MKLRYLFVLVFLLCSSAPLWAITTAIDTVWIDTVKFKYPDKLPFPTDMYGKADNHFVQLDGQKYNSPYFDIDFRRADGSYLPIKANSTVIIWAKKDLNVDTSGAQITFNKFDLGGTLVSTDAIILNDGINVITVPAEDYEYIELSLTVNPNVGTVGKSYFFDAIAIVEDTSRPSSSVPRTGSALSNSGLRSNYPNPFEAMTTVNYTIEQGGSIELAVVDLTGTEHTRISLGYQNEGAHEAELHFSDHGMYFARLYKDGVPYGNVLKIVSK